MPLNDDSSAAPHVADEVRTLALLTAALLLVPGYIFAAPSARTEGIYTAAQAARGGKEVYSASCASCHAADLSGGGNVPAPDHPSAFMENKGSPTVFIFALAE